MLHNPKKAIVGAWRLVHSVEIAPDGTPHYPFGQDALGCIIYSESGIMAVQITRRDRAEWPRGGAVGPDDYLAYFGRYELDIDQKLVRHLLEGQLHPARHPEILERKYRFYDDKLSLRPWDGTIREILWQRA